MTQVKGGMVLTTGMAVVVVVGTVMIFARACRAVVAGDHIEDTNFVSGGVAGFLQPMRHAKKRIGAEVEKKHWNDQCKNDSVRQVVHARRIL